MNSDQLRSNWKELKGSVQERWERLTDDDLEVIDGQQIQLVGKIRQKYCFDKQEAQNQVEQWMRSDFTETDMERHLAS